MKYENVYLFFCGLTSSPKEISPIFQLLSISSSEF